MSGTLHLPKKPKTPTRPTPRPGPPTPGGLLGDETVLFAFLERALSPYEDDPRPVEMTNMFGLGITASLNKEADGETCATITKPERH